MWRQKLESGEGGVRSEEMDELRRKMNAKLQEAEAAAEAAQAKASSLEKVKNRWEQQDTRILLIFDYNTVINIYLMVPAFAKL